MGSGIVAKASVNRVREPCTYWASFERRVAFKLACGYPQVILLRRLGRGRSGTCGVFQELKC